MKMRAFVSVPVWAVVWVMSVSFGLKDVANAFAEEPNPPTLPADPMGDLSSEAAQPPEAGLPGPVGAGAGLDEPTSSGDALPPGHPDAPADTSAPLAEEPSMPPPESQPSYDEAPVKRTQSKKARSASKKNKKNKKNAKADKKSKKNKKQAKKGSSKKKQAKKKDKRKKRQARHSE